jgi:hypothetical protein
MDKHTVALIVLIWLALMVLCCGSFIFPFGVPLYVAIMLALAIALTVHRRNQR